MIAGPLAFADSLGYDADDFNADVFTGEGCCLICCASVRGDRPCNACRVVATQARRVPLPRLLIPE